ncbi:hypothetical protein COB64_03280 [Candidatus Wolfebacteria bacterium]|nr:MAG: hypothetical protein COB64_03280 [Candidatus Wolfebacteria bacterium]
MKNKKQNGFIALISVLIIGSVVLVISIGLSLRSVGETDMSLNEELSNRAVALADACSEYALLQVKNKKKYSGNESILIDGDDSCSILEIEVQGKQNITINTQATVLGFTRKVKVEANQIKPTIELTSWKEVADF